MKNPKIYTVKGEGEFIRFPWDQLEHVTIDHYLVTFHLEGNQSFRKSISLKELEKTLQPLFFRVNRNSIINLSKVQRYSKKKRRVVLRNGIKFTVSVRRTRDFEKAFNGLDDTLIN